MTPRDVGHVNRRLQLRSLSRIPPLGGAERALAIRSVERTLANRYSTYVGEVTRLIRAATRE